MAITAKHLPLQAQEKNNKLHSRLNSIGSWNREIWTTIKNDSKEMIQKKKWHSKQERTVQVQMRRWMNKRFNLYYTKSFATENGPDLEEQVLNCM